MIMGYLRVTLAAHGNSSYALVSGEECLVDWGDYRGKSILDFPVNPGAPQPQMEAASDLSVKKGYNPRQTRKACVLMQASKNMVCRKQFEPMAFPPAGRQ